MTKDRITDADLLLLIRKFVAENTAINVTNCDDAVAKLIGLEASKLSED